MSSPFNEIVVPDLQICGIWNRLLDPKTDHQRAMRSLIEELWVMYEPIAEPNFLAGLQSSSFSGRWWEMYLWHRLSEYGFRLEQPGEGMPDIRAEARGRTIFFECVSPTSGEHSNRIPEYDFGEAHSVPVEKILLRLTSAFFDKHKQSLSPKRRNLPGHYIIAIDSSQIRNSGFDEEFYVKTLFPIGDLTMTFTPGEQGATDSSYTYQETLLKSGGAAVSKSPFLGTRSYKNIAAVLFCNANVGNIAAGDNPGFTIVHNHHAEQNISRKLFRSERQWFWDGSGSVRLCEKYDGVL